MGTSVISVLERCFGPDSYRTLVVGLSLLSILAACAFLLIESRIRKQISTDARFSRAQLAAFIALILVPGIATVVVIQRAALADAWDAAVALIALVPAATVLIVVVLKLANALSSGLPLATKEFLEQSSRRRTFFLRVVYSTLIFLAALSFSYETLTKTYGNGLEILGQGQVLFTTFLDVQFTGLYLFMPAMTCSLLTSEKERDSLSLLFLTRLSLSGILAGKLVSRMFPMLLFVSMSLPLFAVAYAFGGVDQQFLWASIWVLFVSTLQCAAFGLFCSAWFRSTVAAFMATYVLGFAWMFFPPIVDELTGAFRYLYEGLSQGFDAPAFMGFHEGFFTAIFVPPVLLHNVPGGTGYGDVYVRTIPVLAASLMLLLLTRAVLFRRAFTQPRQPLIRLFRFLDRVFLNLNSKFGGGVVLTEGDNSLPDRNPVAWRETSRRPLGTVRYLVRVLVALEFPVAFICAMSVVDSYRPTEPVSMLLYVVWVLAVLLICAKSSSLISSERSHQTLDVLLTTPMSNRQILAEKIKGVRRLIGVLWVPFGTIYLFQVWMKTSVPRHMANINSHIREGEESFYLSGYIFTAFVTTALYLSLVSWMSFLIGMKVRSQAKAIFLTMAILVAWSIVPIIVAIPFELELDSVMDGPALFLQLSTPVTIISGNEYHLFRQPFLALALNTAFYGSILVLIRLYCRGSAHRLFGRIDDEGGRRLDYAEVRTKRPVTSPS